MDMDEKVDGMTALVVDDFKSMRLALREILQGIGFSVTEAVNGLEGFEQVKNNPPDMIFTDIVMPVMDGLELCQELKNDPDLVNIPVVVLSTHADASYILKAIHNGADDYVPKPIEIRLIKKVVARLTYGR